MEMVETQSSKNPMLRVMSLRDFRLLFTGATTSLLGDQFALIATPWLVLQLTGDPLALGIVLALEGIPRAAFMLLGGAITDRLSPRLIMLISDVTRFVLTSLMAFVVFTGIVQMWMLYAFSLGFGLVAGFAVLAESSIVPMLVEERDLQAGNSIIMGVTRLVGFVGPTIAGIPVLADTRLPEGAVAFGLLMSAFSGGNLVGYLLSGSLPRPTGIAMRLIVIALLAAFGAVVGSLGFISSTWVDFSLLLLLGLGNGYVAIILFTWIQMHTPKEMLGRMMSLLMFSNTGLVPVSQAISGAVSKWDLTLLFASARVLVLLVTLWAAFQPGFKAFSESLAQGEPIHQDG
jgi:MFS family permease